MKSGTGAKLETPYYCCRRPIVSTNMRACIVMRVLITGASGFIGSELSKVLRARGHEVITLVRSEPTDASERYWKPADLLLEPAALEGAEAIIHLAGASIAGGRWTDERKAQIYDSRIESTRLLVDRMAEMHTPPRVFVCASAIGYYGDRGDSPLTEADEPGTGFLPDVCKDWEAEAMRAASHGIRTVRIRTGVVLGTTGGALGEMLLPFKLGIGGRLGSGKQYMSWVSKEDIVNIYAEAVENETLNGAVNATSPNPVTNRAFTKTLGAVMKRPTILPVPRFGIKALFGEMGEHLLLDSARVLPYALMAADFEFRHTDLRACLEEVLGD